jgi:hypothetical protein
VISGGRNGKNVDTAGVAQAVNTAVAYLQAGAKVQVGVSYTTPTVADDDPRLSVAQNKANSYLKDGLVYHYEADGIQATDIPVTKKDIASFISINSAYEVSINRTAIDNYVANIAKTYLGKASLGNFITTHGYALTSSTYQVPYYKVVLDKAHLSSDLLYCVENGITGTRNAQFLPGTSAKPYDGTYVEISIDDQHLWFYKNDKLVVSTDVITGKVSAGWGSRTGIFTVNGGKRPNVGLVGSDYYAFVNYWMPYIEGVVGMHDCTWHDEFGGDVFIYDGSHGCINIPLNTIGYKTFLYHFQMY